MLSELFKTLGVFVGLAVCWELAAFAADRILGFPRIFIIKVLWAATIAGILVLLQQGELPEPSAVQVVAATTVVFMHFVLSGCTIGPIRDDSGRSQTRARGQRKIRGL